MKSRLISQLLCRLGSIAFCGLLVATLLEQESSAQESAATTSTATLISATGSHEVTVVPTQLRLKMQMKAESRDPKDALMSLKAHQAKVKKALEGLKVAPSKVEMLNTQVVSGIPGVEDPENAKRIIRQQAAQMRNMNPQLRAQLGQMDEEEAELPVVYTASCVLKAEWQLPKELNDDALVLPVQLKAEIESRDFRGNKLREELSQEEQAVIQPLLGANVYYSNNNRPADFQLVFVGPIDAKTETNAIKSAFENAKSRAERTAEATGGSLGTLRNISAPTVTSTQNQQYTYVYSANGSVSMMPIESSDKEVANADPNSLTRHYSVNVSFELKKK